MVDRSAAVLSGGCAVGGDAPRPVGGTGGGCPDAGPALAERLANSVGASTSLPTNETLFAVVSRVGEVLAAAALHAPEEVAPAEYWAAADFAAVVEDLSRTVEYLQILSAGSVDTTRTAAIAAALTRQARPGKKGWVTGWNADGVETLAETDADWPPPTAEPAVFLHPSPADDGCRNTAEFLRLRLRVPIREARRRLSLAAQVLPGTAMTGIPLPPIREGLATALAPSKATAADGTVGSDVGMVGGPVVSSYAATVIAVTLDRIQHSTTTERLGHVEQDLIATAATADPDFLVRVAQRWVEAIDADGTEPSEEALRHTQGAFIRKPRNGLHHLEIFATADQYEHLVTAMNIATNPRTTTPDTTENSISASVSSSSGTGTSTGIGTDADLGVDLGAVMDNTVNVDLERRTRPQQQLDGVISAIKAGLTTTLLPITGGMRPQIIATISVADLFPARTRRAAGTELTAFAGDESGDESDINHGSGAFAFTGPTSATTLRKIACDADIIPALLGTKGEVLDLGRKTRLFTTAQRLALVARDQGCTFPNCTIPAPWCEAHHVTYWNHGGLTTTSNGALLCSHHHHLIHKDQWSITITGGMPAFIPPPHIDPKQRPQRNRYFKPPPLPS